MTPGAATVQTRDRPAADDDRAYRIEGHGCSCYPLQPRRLLVCVNANVYICLYVCIRTCTYIHKRMNAYMYITCMHRTAVHEKLYSYLIIIVGAPTGTKNTRRGRGEPSPYYRRDILCHERIDKRTTMCIPSIDLVTQVRHTSQ